MKAIIRQERLVDFILLAVLSLNYWLMLIPAIYIFVWEYGKTFQIYLQFMHGNTVLTDKEETGSDGNTGLNSSYLKYFVEDLARLEGFEGRDVLRNSKCLSADVNAAYDPTWSTVFEKNNASFINNGVCVTKFTGARGKSGTSDASAEFCAWVGNLLDENNVLWQTGELGKVDGGGGGTVAMYIANMDVDTIDVGVPVLSMHAPYEIVSKIDVYSAYKAFLTFFTK